MFSIKYWEDEEARDQGTSEDYGTCQRCNDAVDTANRLYEENVAVEVVVGDTLVYHISDTKEDAPYVEDNRSELDYCARTTSEVCHG